jgi:flagellar motor switch/type III secretory pathway protein FliN
MAEFNASLMEQVLTTCREGAGEAAEALTRALDAEVSVTVGDGETLDAPQLPDDFSGPALVVVLHVESEGALVAIPKASGLVPDWCDDPDPTGQSKLTTLAQELGMILLPEDFMPMEFQSGIVEDLTAALKRGNLGEGAAMIPLQIAKNDGEGSGSAVLLWPVAAPGEVIPPPAEEEKPSEPAPESKKSADDSNPSTPSSAKKSSDSSDSTFSGADLSGLGMPGLAGMGHKNITLDDLPGYARSLLKIKVPACAVLARTRRPIKNVLELGIGSIIQFDKSCDELLELDIDKVTVANGEAVKVGDKFGIRLNDIILPEERIRKIEVRRQGEYQGKRGPAVIGKAPIDSL